MDDPQPILSLILLSGFFKSVSISALVSVGVLLILIVFSALISGSEVAFFSLKPNEKEILNSSNSKAHLAIKKILERPKYLLATILISNNFVNVAVIILSTYVINDMFDFSTIDYRLNFLIQVAGITFIILLFGEVIPKVYATKHALKLANIMVGPITVLKKIFKPISSLLIFSTGIIDRKITRKGLNVSVEELSTALDLTEGIPENKDEHRILKGIVKFGETNVRQIMQSRVDVMALDVNTTYDKIIETIINSGYSRIPIYEDSFDKIVGLIYVKDLLSHINEKDDFDWKSLMRKPFFIPESKKLDDLLKEFQEKKVHFAIVVDEYGGTSGIITLEDVLEEIVGEISDEFDTDDVSYSKLDDNTYVFDAKTGINDLLKVIKIEDESIFDETKKDADTLAGLIIEIAGKIPQKNERIIFNQFTFIIEASDKRRIKRVKLIISTSQENEN